MSTLTPEIRHILSQNAAIKDIMEEIGDVPPDTVIDTKHAWRDHILGPQKLSEIFNSPERVRPHEKRVLMGHYDPFYVFQGTTRVIGTAWLSGILIGGVQGFYEGLAARQTRSWRTAYQSLHSFSRTKGPVRGNQYAAVAFAFCMWESFARHMVMKNETMLQYNEQGYILGKYGSTDPEKKEIWQTDSRLCAPVGAAGAALSLRLIKGGASARPGVLLTNTALSAVAGYMFAHLWSKEDYFDIELKFFE